MSQTFIVSNRLPVSVRKSKKGIEVYPSTGGLATGLSTYANKRGNLWIGWPGLPADDLTEKEKQTITRLLGQYNCWPVFLTKQQIDDFYNGYSNSILWPFLHQLEADFSHEDKQWKVYYRVNELFAESILTLSEPGATIWVHDYQLMLLPKMLRTQHPQDNIGFFLHIPFPPVEHFKMLKHSAEIVRGILGADLVGFHTKTYADHFIATCSTIMTNAVPTADGIALKNRAVRITDFPIGIDYMKFARATKQQAVQRELRKLRHTYAGQRIILTVDRLDPSKGFIERLQAYKTFLTETPELHGRVTMIMLAVPSREDVKAYRELKTKVDKLVKEINKKFGAKSWKPIVYMYQSVPFEYLSALYQLADIAFIAPIRDGMNLVAKEYVASQDKKHGILILSQSAGAAEELKDALLVNPHEPRTLVTALKEAVKMPPKELKRRIKAMQTVTAANTIYNWAGSFMQALNKPVPGIHTQNLTQRRLELIINNYQGSTNRLILLDYDGVLAPFVKNPKDAAPNKKILSVLKQLAKTPRTNVVVISGRNQQDLATWLGKLPITLIAEHGGEIRYPNEPWVSLFQERNDWKEIIQPILELYAEQTPGARVEEKTHSLVWHYRDASPYHAQKNIVILKSVLKPKLSKLKLKLFMGNKIIEIKNPHISKGSATKLLLKKPYDFIMAIGDDFTDEDMFNALPKQSFTVKVGPGKTIARYRLKNTEAVLELLNSIIFADI